MLLVLMLRGPHCPKDVWFGWQGGWGLKAHDVEKGASTQAKANVRDGGDEPEITNAEKDHGEKASQDAEIDDAGSRESH